jgi:hypothetical protein
LLALGGGRAVEQSVLPSSSSRVSFIAVAGRPQRNGGSGP